ncbi:hypothetical protein SCHPADRAFT_836480 [Schizopora paradoxa]|uniref:Uncharacterized protein n=1 Tax=Schizopora paradoxa TaxID=27342 RepID=A0A0H2R876_9AGAM|nr:hypothetical protein SCHPADRAFT_836480 [Schizopora paradoxa]
MAAANLYDLPYFIMLSQSTMPLAGENPSTSSLVHPVIQYHFADDNPHDILPRYDGESVIILDYERGRVPPLVESASKNIAVTGIKVTDAPPSSVPSDGETRRNDNMFIIETISDDVNKAHVSDAASSSLNDPRHILAQFRERNAVLKQVLDHPSLREPEERLRNGDASAH